MLYAYTEVKSVLWTDGETKEVADGDGITTMIATVIYVTSGLIAITAIAMIVIGVWIYFRHAGQYFVFLIRNILCSRCETIGAARVFGCGCPVVRLSTVKFKITFNFLLQVLRLLHCTPLLTLLRNYPVLSM